MSADITEPRRTDSPTESARLAHDPIESPDVETSRLVHVTKNDIIDSLGWISLSCNPMTWLSSSLQPRDAPNLLIPENPILYVWWQACQETNMLLLPALFEDAKMPDVMNAKANDSFLQDSAVFPLVALLFQSKDSSIQEIFVEQNKIIVDRMKHILARPADTPLMRFYKSFVRDWEPLMAKFNTQLLLTSFSNADVLYTASVLAGEYMVNGLARTIIPASVQARLEQSLAFYEQIDTQQIEVGLIALDPSVSLQLVPTSTWLARYKTFSMESMSDFALSGAINLLPDPQGEFTAHKESLVHMLVSQIREPIPRDLAAWKDRVDKIVKMSTLVLKPFYAYPTFKYESSHTNIYDALHVTLLDSLKSVLSRIYTEENQVAVFTRLEYNAALSQMVYLVYLVYKVPSFDESHARLGEQPWHDRWTFFKEKPWTRRVLEWIALGNNPNRGLKLMCPMDIMNISPLMRTAWWIEEHLRALFEINALDISSEWDPCLGTVCLSVLVPKYVTWDKSFTMSLSMLKDSEE